MALQALLQSLARRAQCSFGRSDAMCILPRDILAYECTFVTVAD